MAFNYGETAQDVRETLSDVGALAGLVWTPAPTSDAPDAPLPPAVSVTAWGIILDYPAKAIGTQPDSLIRAGDRQVLLSAIDEQTGAAMPLIPPEASILAPDGVTYVVKNAKVLNPAGVVVMFDLTVRR